MLKPVWSTNLGFFHVYPVNSVQSLHRHIVNMNYLGAFYYNSEYKNLSLDIVLDVFRNKNLNTNTN